MPIFTLRCPECNHIFQGLVLTGTREPEIWVCSKCGSEQAQKLPEVELHPWEGVHGQGCSCCAFSFATESKTQQHRQTTRD
ncbi:MAG: hypothetical protein HC875_08485 [Anaerolineales bacterium]|nr:hypothetical protein [Anaerolineales bacterium]